MSTVLFIDDVARELRISRREIQRQRRHGVFPIPTMPKLDKRPRWSSDAVEAFKAKRDEHAQTLRERRGFRTGNSVARFAGGAR